VLKGCLKGIHSVEISIVANGYGFQRHKPLKKWNIISKKTQCVSKEATRLIEHYGWWTWF